MATRSLIALMTCALLAGPLTGCDRERTDNAELGGGGTEQEETPNEERTVDDETLPATTEEGAELIGEEGMALPEEMDRPTELCVAVFDRIGQCTSQDDFVDALTANDVLTGTTLQEKAYFWREPGGLRQTCRQVRETATEPNPFTQEQALRELAAAAKQPCDEFIVVIEKMGVPAIIAETK